MNTKKLILYGAGQVGQRTVDQLLRFNIPVECFCDADVAKKGHYISGVVVKTITEVSEQYIKGTFSICITISNTIRNRIKDDLISSGIFEDSDFSDLDLDMLVLSKLSRDSITSKEDRDYYIDKVGRNYIWLNNKSFDVLKSLLLETRFNDDEYMNTENGKRDFEDHLFRRLDYFRKSAIPWLESIHPLKNSKILEIGCGTGAFTVAICEQGAEVYAIDVNEESLEVAKKRLSIYGLDAILGNQNAAEMNFDITDGFNFIIYSASLEHMTYSERLKTIKIAYNMISENQYIVLLNTPNRLWHTDSHTSLEPFYNWVPDEMAMDYASLTKRDDFNKGFDKKSKHAIERFHRWGRGVSYHEFEVALGRGTFEVFSSMDTFFDTHMSIYEKILALHGPDHIDIAFYTASLDLAIKKKLT